MFLTGFVRPKDHYYDWGTHMPSGSRLVLACFGLLIASRCVMAEGPTAPTAADHSQLMVYWTADGRNIPSKTRPIGPFGEGKSSPEWKWSWQAARSAPLPPLDVKVVERVQREGRPPGSAYLGADNDQIPAHLYLPKNRPAGRRLAAMLALHQTSPLGKKEVSDEDGAPPNQAYGKELAERGYVMLAPDYLSFGDYSPISTRASLPREA